MTEITEVLSVSSAARLDKEMPREGIRISTDTIYCLCLIRVAGLFANVQSYTIYKCTLEYLEMQDKFQADCNQL